MKLNQKYTILPLLLWAVGLCLTAEGRVATHLALMANAPITVMADSTRFGEDFFDEEEEKKDTVKRTRTDWARREGQFNALSQQLAPPYQPEGETFTRGLLKNLYFMAGLGAERIEPQAVDGYEILPLTTFHAGVGTHFNYRHGMRLTFDGGMGYQRDKNAMFFKYGAKLDYLYDLSSHLSGYSPARLANVSAIIGVGAQQSHIHGYPEKENTFEGHVGMQLKFFTGPHVYVTMEPYLGLGGDQMDLSKKRNWRGYDIFYGANIGMVYYLHSNLSPEARIRIIEERWAHNMLSSNGVGDSVLKAWQQPWFVQVASGPTVMNSPRIDMMDTRGSEMSVAVGKWLSPVLGFRATLASRNTTWSKRIIPKDASSYHPEYREDLHNNYRGVRIEAMINPIGFFQGFDWDSHLGFSLVGGVEMGQLYKMQSEILTCWSEAYGGGVNLWWQPVEGVKLFMEPRFMHCIYRIPYSNVSWYGRFSDNSYSLSVGVAVETRNTSRWYQQPSYEYLYAKDPLRMITVGLGGGSYLIQPTLTYSEDQKMGFNGLLFGEYHFDRRSSARLGVEYMQLRRTNISDFTDYNLEVPEENYAPVPRYGLWENRFNVIAVSPGYQGNLSQWLFDYQAVPLKLHAFAGPTVFLRLKPQSKLSHLERLMENHRVELNIPQKLTFHVGAHLGLKLDCRLSSRLGIFFSPTVYWVNNMELPGMNLNNLRLIQTFNLGVQYGFGRK